jgi:hypothetical protein
MIVAEHPSKSPAPDDWAVKFANGGARLQQPVAESSMISLALIAPEYLRFSRESTAFGIGETKSTPQTPALSRRLATR